MHHVYLEWEVFTVDVVLGWSVHMKLDKAEVCSVERCGAVHHDFNSGS